VAGEALGMMERDLGEMIEGPFAVLVELLPPGGAWIRTSLRGGPLHGLWTNAYFDTEGGEQVVVNEPCLCLRRSSLSRIPLHDEKWALRVQDTPGIQAMAMYVLSTDKVPKSDMSRGIIYLFPQAVSQS